MQEMRQLGAVIALAFNAPDKLASVFQGPEADRDESFEDWTWDS